MAQAFIIMQIGNQQLDHACEQAIVPALKACGLNPKRVDKHNEGGLLKSEIVSFIELADIIVADLTNERPNVYLEVGYAMGVDKFKNLILTAREDHNESSPNHQPHGPRVHFDLAGYDILFWDPTDLDGFRSELEKRIRRRQAIITPAGPRPTWDNEWLKQQQGAALAGSQKASLYRAFMEVCFSLSDSKLNRTQAELLQAAERAPIHTSGWPIGIVFENRDEFRPRPRADGIAAEITTEDSYDYWALRRNGDFYLFQTLSEDRSRKPGTILFDIRIMRVTETLLYCRRLYSHLGVSATDFVNIGIRHGLLSGRVLGAGGFRYIHKGRSTSENEVYSEIHVSLSTIESDLVELVKALTRDLFILFDFFEVSDAIYSELVDNFVAGKIV